jgi:hypothetical protein
MGRPAFGYKQPGASNYPFTDPDSSPLTKNLCSAKKITIGSAMEINAAAVSKCQPLPSDVTMLLIW